MTFPKFGGQGSKAKFPVIVNQQGILFFFGLFGGFYSIIFLM